MEKKTTSKISGQVKTAQGGGCNGCEADWGLCNQATYKIEAPKRLRYHLNIGGTILRLCPDCAKQVRDLLFQFSAH